MVMVTLIIPITCEQGFDNFKRSLVNLESDWGLGIDVLCLVSDKNLYLECRDFLLKNINRGECRVAFEQDNLMKKAADYLGNKNDFVFLTSEEIIIPAGGITKLYGNYIDKPESGFISGIFKNYPVVYWVKDIYENPGYVYFDGDSPELLMGIDVSPVYGMLTKTSLYKELFCMENLDGYGSLSYGVRLRRQGYKNYANTSVVYRQGGNKK